MSAAEPISGKTVAPVVPFPSISIAWARKSERPVLASERPVLAAEVADLSGRSETRRQLDRATGVLVRLGLDEPGACIQQAATDGRVVMRAMAGAVPGGAQAPMGIRGQVFEDDVQMLVPVGPSCASEQEDY